METTEDSLTSSNTEDQLIDSESSESVTVTESDTEMPKPKQKPLKEPTKGKKTNVLEEIDVSESKEEQINNIAPIGDSSNAAISETSKSEPVQTVEESVEVKYEDPVLTQIIVESYEGGKEKGFFEGLGKVCFRGGHYYEGEFFNGMMSGKGKYIWAEGIIYEGDFLNNEIIGNGKYTWISSKHPDDPSKWATYEGELFKGKRHGLGTFKSGLTPVMYIGEWNLGKRCGKGKIIYDAEGRSFYEGDWIDNKKFGWGIRHYPSGNIYEGMWVNDVRHGEGTMRWFEKNQTYTGQWENGIQNGVGEHNWYLARVDSTQYALRNTYYGNFLNGKRHGQGTFLYANGAKYEGMWHNNLKHGWGKFTYKDGKVYEGCFQEDKMTDSTNSQIALLENEFGKANTRAASAGNTLNIHLLRANHQSLRSDFIMKLEFSSILEDFENIEKRNLESVQAYKTVVRYLDLFKQVYRFYSILGMDLSPDNTYILNRMQFWRFLKDCKIYLNDDNLTLMDFDRILGKDLSINDLHCPYDKILIREFLNYIVIISYHLYKEQFDGNGLLISWCIEKLIVDNILPYSCNVKGYFYVESRKTLNVLTYMVRAYEIYQFLSVKRKKKPFDRTITMRKFLNDMNDLKLIDGKILSTKEVVEILASDNPLVYDSENAYNLELEMTFLEFFEALIGCALKSYDNLELQKTNTIDDTQMSVDMVNTQRESLGDTSTETSPISKGNFARSPNPSIQKSEKDSISRIETKMESKDETKVTFEENLSVKRFGSQETEQISNRPTSGTEINIVLGDDTIDEIDKEFRKWTEKNHLFFVAKFFPAAQNHQLITQLVNKSL